MNGYCKNYNEKDCPTKCTFECCDNYEPHFDAEYTEQLRQMVETFYEQHKDIIRWNKKNAFVDVVSSLKWIKDRKIRNKFKEKGSKKKQTV